jgi:hypothetical protein
MNECECDFSFLTIHNRNQKSWEGCGAGEVKDYFWESGSNKFGKIQISFKMDESL